MIVDCFPFLNEYDLLELRLNELWPVVDKFVLVEGTRTFSNKPKGLHYEENKDRFKPYASKIEHVVMDDYSGIDTGDSWAMEHAQKELGYRAAIKNLSAGDIVIVSDCDELPRRSAVESALDKDWHIIRLEMPLYYYWMNCQWAGKKWRFAKAIRLNGGYVSHERIRHRKNENAVEENSGWHFSYLSDIGYKIGCSAHVEYDKPPYTDPDHIESVVADRKDLFGRKCRLDVIKDLGYLPQYVLDHQEIYSRYIL